MLYKSLYEYEYKLPSLEHIIIEALLHFVVMLFRHTCIHLLKRVSNIVSSIRPHERMDRSGVVQVPGGSGEQGEIEKTGYRSHLWCPTHPHG